MIGIARTVSEAVGLHHAQHADHAIVDIHLADNVIGTELMNQTGEPTPMSIPFASDVASGMSLIGHIGHRFYKEAVPS